MDAQPPTIPCAGQIPSPPPDGPQQARCPVPFGAKHCKNCGFVGSPALPGHGLVELLLWLCYLLPGLIYSLWRRGSGKHVCPTCHAPYMIPLSPAHLGGHAPPQQIQSASVQPGGALLPPKRSGKFPTWAVVLLVSLVVILAVINATREASKAARSTPANEPTFTPAEDAKQRRDIQELIRKSQEGH